MRIDLLHPWPARLGFGLRLEALGLELSRRHEVLLRRSPGWIPGVFRTRRPPDMVLVFVSLMAPLVLLLRLWRPGLRICYLVRGDEISEASARGRWFRAWVAGCLQSLFVRLEVRFVFVSWDLELLFRERHPRLSDTRVLPNTLGRPLPPVRPFDDQVAVVGEFGSLKRIEWLLTELAGSGCTVHVFGNSTSPSRWMGAGVVIHGHVTDLSSALAQHCSLLVMASLSEGFPNVIIDAQAAGCAILLPTVFPFAHFPLHEAWRFAPETGVLARRLDELRRAPRSFAADNVELRTLLESDWGRHIEEALA